MTRRRYVQIDGELVEVTPDYVAPPRIRGDSLLWNDRLYQDDGDPRYNSRSQHREYMRRNNLTTIDEMHGEWRAAERRRLEIRQGKDPSTKRDLIESIQKLQQRRR
jgi:hypothetical protein